MEISQLVSGFTDGDAISNYAIELQRIIRSWGYPSHIYGVSQYIHSSTLGRCLDVHTYVNHPHNIMIYHFSVGSEMTEHFRNSSGKKVLIYHNITPAKYFQSISEITTSVLKEGRKQLNELAKVPDLSLAVSAYNVQELIQAGFTQPQIFPLILNLKDLNTSPPKKILNQFRIQGLNILFVGRVAPNKKIEDLILSFHQIKKHLDPKAKLIIVGTFTDMDRYLTYLKGLANKLELQDIFFTGHVVQKDLISYYQIADVFLCMSEHEGFCLPLLEAMHFDVPVMAYDAAGVSGTLSGAGVLLKKKDYPAIAEMVMMLYENKELRLSVVQKQRERLKDFDQNRWANTFKSLLSPLIHRISPEKEKSRVL